MQSNPISLLSSPSWAQIMSCPHTCYMPHRTHLFPYNRSAHHCDWLIPTHTHRSNIFNFCKKGRRSDEPPLYSPSGKRHYCSCGFEGQQCSTFNEIITVFNNCTPQNLNCTQAPLTHPVSFPSQEFLYNFPRSSVSVQAQPFFFFFKHIKHVKSCI